MPPGQPPDDSLATTDDLRRLEQQVRELLARLEHLEREHKMQFTRLAQLQADVDVIHAGLKPVDRGPYTGHDRRRSSGT